MNYISPEATKPKRPPEEMPSTQSALKPPETKVNLKEGCKEYGGGEECLEFSPNEIE